MGTHSAGAWSEQGGQTVVKTLTLLVALLQNKDGSCLSDLASMVSLPPATTYRLLRTLEDFNVVVHECNRYGIANLSNHLAPDAS
jgi:DNA-binding IclR family transcriptional regulator